MTKLKIPLLLSVLLLQACKLANIGITSKAQRFENEDFSFPYFGSEIKAKYDTDQDYYSYFTELTEDISINIFHYPNGTRMPVKTFALLLHDQREADMNYDPEHFQVEPLAEITESIGKQTVSGFRVWHSELKDGVWENSVSEYYQLERNGQVLHLMAFVDNPTNRKNALLKWFWKKFELS